MTKKQHIKRLAAMESKAAQLTATLRERGQAARKAGVTKDEMREELKARLGWDVSAQKPDSKAHKALKKRISVFLSLAGFAADHGGGKKAAKAVRVSDRAVISVIELLANKFGIESNLNAVLHAIAAKANNYEVA